MTAETKAQESSIRYEADERPPLPLSAGLGLQLAVLTVAGIVFTPAIVVSAAGGSDEYASWAVFAAVAISGLTTFLQARRIGRVGSGYVLLMGTSGAFIAVCVAAIAKAGPATLATLVIVSSLFQFALAHRLDLFRRVLTPTVAGTVIMLIPVTVMPIVFENMTKVPETSWALAAPLTALVTIVVITVLALKATGTLRLWAPVIGVIVGSVFASFFGLYEVESIASASWIGLPEGAWPGIDLQFGAAFWALLPAFVLVTLIGAIETVGDAVAIQRVSWRKPRAVDYRAVQGALSADGVGNLLSGVAGTVPNTTYSTSIAATELTGVAARTVGIAAGAIFVVFAFVPKALAAVLAVPLPVVGAYLVVLLSLLFVVGITVVLRDGIDYRKGVIVGTSFWVGVGFQNKAIFPELVTDVAGGLFENGMTSGGLVAILLTLFVELTSPRRSKMRSKLDPSALPKIQEFLRSFSSRCGFDSPMATRIEAAAEETLLILHESERESGEPGQRNLSVTALRDNETAVLEFVATGSEENIQDQIAFLGKQVAGPDSIENDVAFRLLRHLSSSVRHQQFHDTDVITLSVKPPSGPAPRQS